MKANNPYRPYNKDTDSYYSPDATPELYLTEEQVNEALSAIPKIEDSAEIAVREALMQIEAANREEKLGSLSTDGAISKIRTISDDFADKYGFWPYVTKTFENFYKLFESGDKL